MIDVHLDLTTGPNTHDKPFKRRKSIPVCHSPNCISRGIHDKENLIGASVGIIKTNAQKNSVVCPDCSHALHWTYTDSLQTKPGRVT